MKVIPGGLCHRNHGFHFTGIAVSYDRTGGVTGAGILTHPLFHSDRGFQYTSAQFHTRLKNHHMKQSMSRVAHCIDNGPMEGFWGILKREMYYRHRFTDKDELIGAISDYIDYYNNRRLQRNLAVMTPMEYHKKYILAA